MLDTYPYSYNTPTETTLIKYDQGIEAYTVGFHLPPKRIMVTFSDPK